MVVIQDEVSDLETNIDFLFDEQVIQDEKLLDLEQETEEIDEQLVVIGDNVESKFDQLEGMIEIRFIHSSMFKRHEHGELPSYCPTGLEDTTLALDFRVTVIEENGGSDGNSSVAELEVRVETLEGTAVDHETRISAAETDVSGKIFNLLFNVTYIKKYQTTVVHHTINFKRKKLSYMKVSQFRFGGIGS